MSQWITSRDRALKSEQFVNKIFHMFSQAKNILKGLFTVLSLTPVMMLWDKVQKERRTT